MQRARFLLALPGIAITGMMIWASGCGTVEDDCLGGLRCNPFKDAGSDSGGGPPLTPSCSGKPTDVDQATMTLKAFNKACAFFAWAGATNPMPDGTMENPFPTIQQAVDAATNTAEKGKFKWIIACNKDQFTENVSISNSAQIYGAWGCTTLSKWDVPDTTMPQKTKLLGKDTTAAALTMNNGGMDVNIYVDQFTITSPDAMANNSSSISVAVDADITAELNACDLFAGKGGDGDNAAPPSGAVNGANAPMPDSLTMSACINPASLAGGKAAMPSSCDDGMSVAGAGGKGGDNSNGAPGGDGQDADAANGKGGDGDTTGMLPGCSDGHPGKDGIAGTDGDGGRAVSATGDMLTLTGIIGGDGSDGKPGSSGRGGGGGGGRKSGNFCAPGNTPGNGASGGGGGAGGCGGKGGKAGKAGASSIGIISLGTKLTLTDVSVTTGNAGNGGAGEVAQAGGAGGKGGDGGPASGFGTSKAGCSGGKGGDGGAGGFGGGGRGGYSLGIAYAGSPSPNATFKFTGGSFGKGGPAMVGASPSSNGDDGLAQQCWDPKTPKHDCMP